MNSTLRKAIHSVHMLCSNYTKQRNGRTWEKYRKQRNLVNKLKKNSTKNYFLERCSGGAKSCDFWKTMKPFFSKKSNSGEQKIIQNEKQQNCKRYQTSYRTFQYFFSLLQLRKQEMASHMISLLIPAFQKFKSIVILILTLNFRKLPLKRLKKL